MVSSGARNLVFAQQASSTPSSGVNSQASSGLQSTQTPGKDEELRADVLMARKEYAEAVPIYQNLIRQEPRNAVLLNKLGIAYHQQAMLGQAKRYYQRAAKADPTNANAVNNIGTVYYQRRKYRKAIHFYEKALAIRQDIPAIYSNLGYAYFGQKHYEEAMAAFHRALELDPSVFERSEHAGSLLQDRSVTDHALFYFFLAKSFATMGNAERCAHYLRKARDEGYRGLASVKTDPAFARVLHDPRVQEILQPTAPVAVAPPKPPGS